MTTYFTHKVVQSQAGICKSQFMQLCSRFSARLRWEEDQVQWRSQEAFLEWNVGTEYCYFAGEKTRRIFLLTFDSWQWISPHIQMCLLNAIGAWPMLTVCSHSAAYRFLWAQHSYSRAVTDIHIVALWQNSCALVWSCWHKCYLLRAYHLNEKADSGRC